MDNNRQIKEPNGPLSWEVKSATWPLGDTGDYDHSVWIQKGKLQLIANSEFDFTDDDDLQEIADTLNGSSSRVQALEEENQEWKQHTKKMIDRLELVEGENWNLKEENKRLQERLGKAENVLAYLYLFNKNKYV